MKKIDSVLRISENKQSVVLTPVTFKKIMMLYPEDGPVISCERTIKERYRCLKEFGILNQTGRVDVDQWVAWVE